MRIWTERKKPMLQIMDRSQNGDGRAVVTMTAAMFGSADRAKTLIEFMRTLYLDRFSKAQLARLKLEFMKSTPVQ